MVTRRPLPAQLRELPFSCRTALDEGVPAGRLRAADLHRPFQGVRSHPDLADRLAWRAAAYLRWRDRPLAFSHETAAMLLSLPLPEYATVRPGLQVTVPAGSRPPEGAGVVGHELAAELWRVRSTLFRDERAGHLLELPLLHPAVLWVQLAARLDRADVVAVGDAIVGGEHPLASIAELDDAAQRWGSRRGARSLAWAVPRIRTGSRSRPESLERLMFVEAGMPEPELNVPVHGADGTELWSPDHSWQRYRTLNEYEGRGHTSPGKLRSDIDRHADFAEAAWSAVRSHSGHVFGDPSAPIRQVWTHLVSNGWRPGRAQPRNVAPARR